MQRWLVLNSFNDYLAEELELLLESIAKDLEIEIPSENKSMIIERTIKSIAAYTVAGYSQTLAKQIKTIRDEMVKEQEELSARYTNE